MVSPLSDSGFFSQLLGLGLAPSDPNQQIALLAARGAILSAAAAIAATIISPVIAYFTNRTQIRANLVSANRQAWINGLRSELSELLELLNFLFLLRPGTLDGAEGIRFQLEKRSKARLLINQIRLRLNPDEEKSKQLLAAINALWPIAISNDRQAEPEFSRWMEAAVTVAHEILKSEWKRVKRGQ